MINKFFRPQELKDPSWFRFLFSNVALAPLWTLARLYIGWQWLQAGYEKVSGTGWVNNDGSALQAFWTHAVLIPASGKPTITYDWYRNFIQFMLDHHWYTWFAWVISGSEVICGIALILGVFVGLTALVGATMNFNFMLAGSASINPVLFFIAILLVLAWKVAGYIGVDHWLLPALGTPWQPGRLLTGVRPTERRLHDTLALHLHRQA